MTTNVAQLTKQWIQYLKSNQIVSNNSDPKTGDLKYHKKVTVEDVSRFLEVTTDFSPTLIARAINSVMNLPPQQAQRAQPNQQSLQKQISHNPNSISDVDYRETPRPTQKQSDVPQKQLGAPQKRLKEAIKDLPGPEVSEDQVTAIFTKLCTAQAKPSQEQKSSSKGEDLKKLRHVIRNSMTTSHRKALWRALNAE